MRPGDRLFSIIILTTRMPGALSIKILRPARSVQEVLRPFFGYFRTGTCGEGLQEQAWDQMLSHGNSIAQRIG